MLELYLFISTISLFVSLIFFLIGVTLYEGKYNFEIKWIKSSAWGMALSFIWPLALVGYLVFVFVKVYKIATNKI